MFTPKQLEEISFDKVMFNGYSMPAVDQFLEELLADYVKLYEDNAQLKQRVRRMAEKMEAMRQEQEAAAAAVEEAKQEAQNILADAKVQAAQILKDAQTTAETGILPASRVSEVQEELRSFITLLEGLKYDDSLSMRPMVKTGTGQPSVDRPWMKFYPTEMMKMMVVPEVTVNQYLRMMARSSGVAAMNYYGTDIIWRDFFQMIDEAARAMRACGLGEGDQIPVLLTCVPEYLTVLLAAERIGASLLCRDNTVEENVAAIAKAEAKVMFVHDYTSAEDYEAYREAGIERFIAVNPWRLAKREEMPDYVIRNLESRYQGEPVTGQDICSWETFIGAGRLFVGKVDAKDDLDRPLFRAYTSGSTGTSKQVIHSARTMVSVVFQMTGYGNSDEFRPTWLVTVLPPALIAVTVSMMLVPLASNRLLMLDPYVDIEDLDLELMRYKPNAWPLIPMFMSVLVHSKRIPADYDMSHLLACGAGAEASNNGQIRMAQKFLDDHNCHVVFSTSYGQSEACSNITFAAPGYPFGNGNVGIPMPLNLMGVFRGDRECSYNTLGEICVSGPGNMLGYDDEEATAKALIRHADGRVWLHTGDTGYMNEDGVVFTLGRGMTKRYHEDPEKAPRLVDVMLENLVSDAEIPGLHDCFFAIRPDAEHENYYVPYMYAVIDEGYTLRDIERGVYDALSVHLRPVEIIQIPERPFYHFKTNRLHLPAPYAR